MKILFTIWMILYPLSGSLESYLSMKARYLFGYEKHDEDTMGISAIINLIIWISVGALLWNHGV